MTSFHGMDQLRDYCYWQREAIPRMGPTATTPILGPGLPQCPGEHFSCGRLQTFHDDGRVGPPASRVGTAANPDAILYIAAKSWLSGAGGGPLSMIHDEVFDTATEFSLLLLGLAPATRPYSQASVRVASSTGSPLPASSTAMMLRCLGMPIRTLFVVMGKSVAARADQSPSSACPTVLLCILAVQRPRRIRVSGGSSRNSGLSSISASRSQYRTPSRHPNKKARAWADHRHHSGIVPSSLARGQGILTVTLSTLSTGLWLHLEHQG